MTTTTTASTPHSGALGARVLELDGATIGIVLPERGPAGGRHVRFYTAEAVYRRLDGQLFRGAHEVLAAARAAFEPRRRRGAPNPPPSPRDLGAEAERTADLVLAAPGPFLQAL